MELSRKNNNVSFGLLRSATLPSMNWRPLVVGVYWIFWEYQCKSCADHTHSGFAVHAQTLHNYDVPRDCIICSALMICQVLFQTQILMRRGILLCLLWPDTSERSNDCWWVHELDWIFFTEGSCPLCNSLGAFAIGTSRGSVTMRLGFDEFDKIVSVSLSVK